VILDIGIYSHLRPLTLRLVLVRSISQALAIAKRCTSAVIRTCPIALTHRSRSARYPSHELMKLSPIKEMELAASRYRDWCRSAQACRSFDRSHTDQYRPASVRSPICTCIHSLLDSTKLREFSRIGSLKRHISQAPSVWLPAVD